VERRGDQVQHLGRVKNTAGIGNARLPRNERSTLMRGLRVLAHQLQNLRPDFFWIVHGSAGSRSVRPRPIERYLTPLGQIRLPSTFRVSKIIGVLMHSVNVSQGHWEISGHAVMMTTASAPSAS